MKILSTTYQTHNGYELSDHLGNVRVVLTDKRVSTYNSGFLTSVSTDISSWSDYFSFGWEIPGRHVDLPNSRYTFNGKELDREWDRIDFEARPYNRKTGRFEGTDANASTFPGWSSYRMAFDNPIVYNDPSGLIEEITIKSITPNDDQSLIKVVGTVELTIKVFDLSTTGVDKAALDNYLREMEKRAQIKYSGSVTDYNAKIPFTLSGNLKSNPNANTTLELEFEIKVNLIVVDDIPELDDDDHALLIVDKIPDQFSDELNRIVDPAGIAQLGGRVMAIEQKYFENASNRDGLASLVHTFLHELGHNKGLSHLFSEPDNLMSYGGGNRLYPKQQSGIFTDFFKIWLSERRKGNLNDLTVRTKFQTKTSFEVGKFSSQLKLITK